MQVIRPNLLGFSTDKLKSLITPEKLAPKERPVVSGQVRGPVQAFAKLAFILVILVVTSFPKLFNVLTSWLTSDRLSADKLAPKKEQVVSERLLFNTNSAIFQLYHGENKLIFNEMVMRDALC